MRVWVIGNAAIDESLMVAAWPVPGMSVLAANTGRDLGGKGANQAVVIARCGAEVGFATCVGDDEAGELVLTTLAAEGIAELRAKRASRPTDRSVILVGPAGENAIVTTADCIASVTPTDVSATLARAAPEDAVLVQGNLSPEATRAALVEARRKGAATAFNPSPIRDGFAGLLAFVDLVIVNLHEARALSGESDPRTAAMALGGRGAGAVVVTLGGAGIVARTADGSIIEVPAVPTEVVDTTGAGDTFAGVLIARWAGRRALEAADIAAAAAAASITVGRRGTRSAFPTRDELMELLRPDTG